MQMSEYGTVPDMAIGIERAWRPFRDMIAALPPEQLDGPVDASGWSVKDHIAHVTAWESGVTAVLQGRPRYEGMGITDEDIDLNDIDTLNARVHDAFASMPADEVVEEAQLKHEGFMMELEALPEEAVRWPLQKYLDGANADGGKRTVGDWFWDNSGAHFEEHLRYIKDILAQEA
jgi:hypothetical protein